MATFESWELPPLPESPILPNTVPTLRETVISPSKAYFSGSPDKHGRLPSVSVKYPGRDTAGGVNTSSPKRPADSAQTYQRQQREMDHFYATDPVHTSQQRDQGFAFGSPRKPTSPSKVPLPPSPVHAGYLSPHRASRYANANANAKAPAAVMGGDSSFMLPSNMSDSLIGDTSMPTMLMNHSLDFGMDSVRAGLPGKQDLGYTGKRDDGDGGSGSVTPTKVIKGSKTPTGTVNRPVPAPTTVVGERRTAVQGTTPKNGRERASPSKTPSTNRPATYPHPTTLSSATRHGIKRHADLDVSTLLPSSPARTAHLLSDKHQLLRESLPMSESEGESFFLPPMPTTARKSPRKPNAKADMTMDINDLMAKMSKPKRPSGTEESFEDLLNAPGFDLDQSMIGNETFLPPDLRPKHNLLQSPVKHTPARIRNAGTRQQSPLKEEVPRSAIRASAVASPRRPAASPSRPSAYATPAAPRLPTAVRDAPGLAASPRRPGQLFTGNRRVSLSTGALPLPASASQSRLGAMASRPGHGRNGSTTAATTTTGVARQAALERTTSSRTYVLASSRAIPSPPKPTALNSPVRSTMPRPAQPRTGSVATGVPQKSRTGSTVSRTTVGIPPTRPASFRPSAQAVPPKSSLPPPASRLTNTARSATTATKSSLPQPGTDSSARSALTRPIGSTATGSRAFGADGSATSNRLSGRPGPTTTSGSSARLGTGKMSMAPPALPVKREATTTSSLKSRATSTPAQTTLARGLPRPLTKTSIPPPSGGKNSTTPASTLPRPPTSRLPATAGASSKLPSAASRNSANITALRARIDALSARQADTRR